MSLDDQETLSYRNIADLRLWEENYNEGNIGLIMSSITAYGFANALRVWRNNRVMAGNHTLQALWQLKNNKVSPPPNIVVNSNGDWLVPCISVEYLSEEKAIGFAILDNKSGQEASQNPDKLLHHLLTLRDFDVEIVTGYDDDDIDYLKHITSGEGYPVDDTGGNSVSEVDADPDSAIQKGKALEVMKNVVIDEPQTQIEKGAIYRMDTHILICAEVISQWSLWVEFLAGDNVLFCPYPGVFVPLSVKAEKYKLVMVQPDPYIAGHMVDRWKEQGGGFEKIR